MNSPIVEDYEASLRDLVLNSRPIIDNLTTIARENTDAAPGILQAITNRIYKAIPEHKLFALYLLDSVCKIVGPPYTVLVAPELFKLFSHVYLLVSDPTRVKLVKMYDLWRASKLKNTAELLFPPEQLDRIGSFLRQAGYRPPPVQTPGVSAQGLVADIDSLLPLMQKRLQQHGHDEALAGRCAALAELRVLLQSLQLRPNELLDIQERLRAMRHQEVYTALLTPKPVPVEPVVPKAEALFSDLVASGLVHVDQSLKPGSRPEYTVRLPKHKFSSSAPTTNALEQLLANVALPQGQSQYEQIKYRELVKVAQKIGSPGAEALQSFLAATLDMSTVQVLYETKALKCSQCGKRFTGDEDGASKKRMHLDWHFRINKKQGKATVQSRNWYLSDLEWVRFSDGDLLEFERPVVKKEEVKAAPVYVVIPANETNMNNTCSICREQIKPTYSDQLGEWIWDGCVYASGHKSGRKVVHATCFAEAGRKRGAEEELETKVKREKV